MSAVIETHDHDDHHHGPAEGLTRWLYTTNHKDMAHCIFGLVLPCS